MVQSISQAMVDGTLGDLNNPPGESLPWHMDMMESVPTLTASSGMKAFRGSGTVLRGGSGVGQNFGPQQWMRQGLSQANYANPRNWRRFGTQDYFHHTGPLSQTFQGPTQTGKPLGRKTVYNPFYAAAGVNWVGRTLGGETPGKMGQWIGNSGAGKWAQERLGAGHGRELVAKGSYSRLSAAGRIGWMSDKQFARGRSVSGAGGFLQGAGYTAAQADDITGRGRLPTQQALMTSGTGVWSSRVGGFMAQAGRPMDASVVSHLKQLSASGTPAEKAAARSALKGGRSAAAMGEKIGLEAGKNYSVRGITQAGAKTAGKATTWGARGMAAARTAGLVGARLGGLAIPGLNLVMAAWLVKDLVQLTTKGIGHAAKIGIDAKKSFMGGMNTGIMGQGFKDTEATMTSRARGVQAIQNSRLNARSVLGNEAGAMAAHFG